MNVIAVIVTGLIVGPRLSSWLELLLVGVAAGLLIGAVMALRGHRWQRDLREGLRSERKAAQSLLEEEKHRSGDLPHLSRLQLFAFESLLTGGLFVFVGTLSRLIFN